MDTNSLISALFYALIGFDLFISRPILASALSIPKSSIDDSSATSITNSESNEQQQPDPPSSHVERPTNNSNKNRNLNLNGNGNGNSIPVSGRDASKLKQLCK